MEVYLCLENGVVRKSVFTEQAIAYALENSPGVENVFYFLADPKDI